MVDVVIKHATPTYYLGRYDRDLATLFLKLGFEHADNVEKADLVVFGGGADINPFLYGERRLKGTVTCYNSDLQDLAVLKKTVRYQSKVGVCRGGQFLNTMLGGRLYQHVTNHATGAMHSMVAVDQSMPIPHLEVTSTHHQMMLPGDDAEVLYGTSLATEKHTETTTTLYPKEILDPAVVSDAEVVLYGENMALCYQPHPEYHFKENDKNTRLFVGLLAEFLLETKHREVVHQTFEKNWRMPRMPRP